MKVLGPKCYSVFDERGGLVEIKTAGLGSAPEIRKIIKKKVTLETFELGLSIPYGATKSRKLKGSGVGITHSVHEIKKKRKSSVF